MLDSWERLLQKEVDIQKQKKNHNGTNAHSEMDDTGFRKIGINQKNGANDNRVFNNNLF